MPKNDAAFEVRQPVRRLKRRSATAPNPNQGAERKLSKTLRHWLRELNRHGKLRRQLPRIRLEMICSATITAQIIPYKTPVIEVSRPFLKAIRRELDSVLDSMMKSCLDGIEFPASKIATVQRLVSGACHDCVLSFVVLHEVFHVLCGHTALTPAGRPFSEISLGLNDSVPRMKREAEVLEAYHQEVEADCCALQCLVELPLTVKPLTLLSQMDADQPEITTTTRVADLRKIPKVVAYRLLLLTAWVVVRLFERTRSVVLQKRNRSHPLPDARMLAAISTLFEEYCGINQHRQIDVHGQPWHRLTAKTEKEGRQFLECVLKPFARATFEKGLRRRSQAAGPEWMLVEFGNLISKAGVLTEAGREIEKLNTVRRRMAGRLAALRYYEGIKETYE